MSETSRRPRRARAWAAALTVVLLAGFALLSGMNPGTRRSDPDARIEFYRLRLGGPTTYPAYTQLGLAYLQKARITAQADDYDQAERYLRQSLEFQRNFEALRGLAALHLARHEFREALGFAEEAQRSLPTDLETQGLLFDIHLALGEQQEAAQIADTMLREQLGFLSFSRLAALDEAQGDYTNALRDMGRACVQAEAEQRSRDVLAWCQVRIGAIFLETCDAAQAEHRYRRALDLVPDYFFAREHLAELRAAQGQNTDAIALYEGLLAEYPRPQYRLALADLYALTGKKEEAARQRLLAAAELRLSVERSRSDWRPLALLLLEDPATAAEGLRWAERDWGNRRDAFAADTLAWAYLKNNRAAEAWRVLGPVIRSRRKNPFLLLHAAEIQLALGHAAEARRLFDEARACPLRLTPAERALAEEVQAALR